MLCRSKSSFGRKGLSYTNIVKKYRTYSLSRFQDFFGGGQLQRLKVADVVRQSYVSKTSHFCSQGSGLEALWFLMVKNTFSNILETVSLSFLTFGWVLKVTVLQSVWNIFMSFQTFLSLHKSCLFVLCNLSRHSN